MWWWSWLLTAVGVFGLWLAGRGTPWGWAVGLGAQGLWVTYAVVTEQYGFFASAGAYGWVYIVNLRKWLKRSSSEGSENSRIQKTPWSGEAMESTVKITIEWPADSDMAWEWYEKIRSQIQHPQRGGKIKVSEPALSKEMNDGP